VKYAVVEADSGTTVADGIVERIGEGEVPDHAAACAWRSTSWPDDMAGPHCVGHRVVHGGPDLYQPTVVDDALIAKLDELSCLHRCTIHPPCLHRGGP